MKKGHDSIDGFIPRRPGSVLGQNHRPLGRPTRPISTLEPKLPPVTSVARGATPLSRHDIDTMLQQIDDEEEIRPRRRRLFRARRQQAVQPKGRARKYVKRFILLVLLIAMLVGGYVGVKVLLASTGIFKGNPFDIFLNQPLKQDENGRTNILIFGTSEDDPDHPGGDLTDSLMVLTLNQEQKDAYMISIPRDLFVKYGAACPEGFQGKINSMYGCFAEGGAKEEEGATALKKKIGEILGLDIQYYAHLNYTVVKDAVDAVGGVDIKIESEDPRGILDRNFDWKCNFKCYYVKYANGEVAHLDGEHALALARARNAAGGYGLPAGNFDREKNQQKIMKALREKAVSAGTLTNIGKVTSLIDAFGANLRTNFATSEIRTLITLGNDIQDDAIRSISLVKEGEEVVTTGNVGGASIVRPIAGLMDYSEIQDYVKKELTSDKIAQEAADIVVLNGSSTPGVAQEEANKLEDKGFNISLIDNAPDGNYEDVEIYQIGDDNPATKTKLLHLFGVKSVRTSKPPIKVSADTDFVIIFGKARSSDNS